MQPIQNIFYIKNAFGQIPKFVAWTTPSVSSNYIHKYI